MKKTILLPVVLAGWAAGGAIAGPPQDAPPPIQDESKDEAQAVYDRLVAEFEAELLAWRDASRRLSETEEYRAARAANDREKIMELRKDLPTVDGEAHVAKFLAEAKRREGRPAQARFLAWALKSTKSKDVAEETLSKLLGAHLESAEWVDLTLGFERSAPAVPRERRLEVIALLIDGHPDVLVQAQCHYARHMILANSRQKPTPEEAELAAADLKRVLELAPESYVGLRANSDKFKKERLQIGMVAPDIEGVDLDGTKFKLSDYRGKVVVLDFWGDW